MVSEVCEYQMFHVLFIVVGGLVVDYPNSAKAKKMFLVLFTGGQQRLPVALGSEQASNHAQFTKREKVLFHFMLGPLSSSYRPARFFHGGDRFSSSRGSGERKMSNLEWSGSKRRKKDGENKARRRSPIRNTQADGELVTAFEFPIKKVCPNVPGFLVFPSITEEWRLPRFLNICSIEYFTFS